MRRLAITLPLPGCARLRPRWLRRHRRHAGPARRSGDLALAPVDVFEVSGIIDPIVASEIELAIDRAEQNGAQALVLQLNSRSAVVCAIGWRIWRNGSVRPRSLSRSGSARPVRAADCRVSCSASPPLRAWPGTRIGNFGLPLEVDGAPLAFGDATDRLRRETIGADDARTLGVLKLRTTDQGAPVLRNMILSLDGLEYRGTVLDTVVETQTADGTIQQNATTARFFKLGLVPRLFHTVASVPVAYLLFVIGLSLLVFEFFTAGVGVAGVVGVVCMVLACYGLGVLPVRGWALAALILSMVCFAVDVQVGVARFWTAVGLLLLHLARSRSTATACRSRGSRCSSALAASRSRSWSACRRWSAPGSPPPRSVAKACSASTASPSPTSDPRVSSCAMRSGGPAPIERHRSEPATGCGWSPSTASRSRSSPSRAQQRDYRTGGSRPPRADRTGDWRSAVAAVPSDVRRAGRHWRPHGQNPAPRA